MRTSERTTLAAAAAASVVCGMGCTMADAPRTGGSAAVVAAPGEVEPFSTTYTGRNPTWNRMRPFGIEGRAPVAEGTCPVLLYTVGTFQDYRAVEAIAWIEAAALAGFVAATVEYANGLQFGCDTITEKAASLYGDAYSENNAVAVVCAHPKADCERGIVTVGLSQGSWMASLAADHEPRVRAALALGTGYDARLWGASHEVCLVTDRTLPPDRLRAVNGESDDAWGTRVEMIAQIDGITASSCGAEASECLRADGSGWLLVRDEDMLDGVANHAYMTYDAGDGRAVDPGWATGEGLWTLGGGLDWLASHVELP